MSLLAPVRATYSWKNWSSRWYHRTWVCVRITASLVAPACLVRHAPCTEALVGVHRLVNVRQCTSVLEKETVHESMRDRKQRLKHPREGPDEYVSECRFF